MGDVAYGDGGGYGDDGGDGYGDSYGGSVDVGNVDTSGDVFESGYGDWQEGDGGASYAGGDDTGGEEDGQQEEEGGQNVSIDAGKGGGGGGGSRGGGSGSGSGSSKGGGGQSPPPRYTAQPIPTRVDPRSTDDLQHFIQSAVSNGLSVEQAASAYRSAGGRAARGDAFSSQYTSAAQQAQRAAQLRQQQLAAQQKKKADMKTLAIIGGGIGLALLLSNRSSHASAR